MDVWHGDAGGVYSGFESGSGERTVPSTRDGGGYVGVITFDVSQA